MKERATFKGVIPQPIVMGQVALALQPKDEMMRRGLGGLQKVLVVTLVEALETRQVAVVLRVVMHFQARVLSRSSLGAHSLTVG